ncbi:putative transcription factor Rap1 [Aspergillus mulundensis]|uniref:DNA-binding protein RAP1 n=1 Tax=Aspergillus mulundensis TaxID=1810919 RepID=A0A3D8S4D5_9EURO|nr:hypothetical protein DSM5745_04720 [Aspergillus mulundensis]RDW81163.1 hypothetical protein DSM5745_04720 [Aspergillus mulundensis]
MALIQTKGVGGAKPGDNEPEHSGLFQGMSFWLAHHVPQRDRFKVLIQENGGIVKLFEKDADVQIVDHKKKNLPSNVYSYQFIEKSIQKGELEDLETHRAGPSTARPVGATNIPARSHRLQYTIEDDQLLYDYLQPYENDPFASVRGNKIYQLFAEQIQHPRHTWQSWRDRYLKRVRGGPRPGGMLEPTARPTDEDRRSHPTRASTSTSHPTAAAAQRNEPSRQPQPQEKKRKRSPEPMMSGARVSNSTSSTKHKAPNRSPAPPAPQVVIASPASAGRRGESPEHELPPASKRAKTTTARNPDKTIPQHKQPQGKLPAAQVATQEPTDEISLGIASAFLELPSLPSSPVAEEALEQDIDAWIDTRLRMGKGKEDQIIEALQCTSMDPGLADKVLDSLIAGKGIPTDMRGVWTAQDDRDVEAQDTRDIQRVIKKHGDLFDYRWEYLNMTRAAGPSAT